MYDVAVLAPSIKGDWKKPVQQNHLTKSLRSIDWNKP